MIAARKVSVMVSTLALGLAACGGKGPEAPPPRDALEATPSTQGTQGPSDIPPAAEPQDGQGSQSGAQTGTALTQEQIVGITSAADSGEISRAQLAQTMAKSDKVKKFAERLANDHMDRKNKQAELAQKLRIAPAETPTSRQLESDSAALAESLKVHRGADFDRAYVEAEIRQHLALLDLIDSKLIPNARDTDLRSSLQDYRSKVESHLKEAQDLQKELASGK
jgi:putative membrane protein